MASTPPCPSSAQVEAAILRARTRLELHLATCGGPLGGVPIIGGGWRQLGCDPGRVLDSVRMQVGGVQYSLSSVPAGCLTRRQWERVGSLYATASAEQRDIATSPGWQEYVAKIAIGALGAVLILVGLIMIASDVTLSQAAGKFGREIGKTVKR